MTLIFRLRAAAPRLERRAVVLFQFGEHSIDVDRRELRRGAELVEIGPQVFDLLVFLIRNRDHVVSKDDLLNAVWAGRIVSESTLTSRINAARRAVGDSGAEQSLIKTVARKGFRFVGEVEEAEKVAPAGRVESVSARLRQEIQFCTAPDGVCIAYTAVGQGPPLVKTANWLNHLDYDVTGFLSSIRVPTLVLHCRNDAAVAFEEGRRMAAGISGSRLVALEGNSHLILEHEPAWARLLEETTLFLGS